MAASVVGGTIGGPINQNRIQAPPLSLGFFSINSNNKNHKGLISIINRQNRSRRRSALREGGEGAMAMEIEEKMGIKIQSNPPESKLTQLGVRTWPKWGCPPSKFPWTYSAKETCYLLKGKVKVYPDGHNEFVEFGAGDLVEFPKGMSCTWDVSETVDKHYNFE